MRVRVCRWSSDHVSLISNTLLLLLSHPDEMARLRECPALLEPAIEEALRYEAPSQIGTRIASEDFELRGRRIAQGAIMILGTAAANRDPLEFPEPDRFDITRSPNRHLSFGWRTHFCLGAPLARAEARVARRRCSPPFRHPDGPGPHSLGLRHDHPARDWTAGQGLMRRSQRLDAGHLGSVFDARPGASCEAPASRATSALAADSMKTASLPTASIEYPRARHVAAVSASGQAIPATTLAAWQVDAMSWSSRPCSGPQSDAAGPRPCVRPRSLGPTNTASTPSTGRFRARTGRRRPSRS